MYDKKPTLVTFFGDVDSFFGQDGDVDIIDQIVISRLCFFCWSSSLVARAHIINCEEVGCRRFELRPLQIICNNIPIN